MVQAARARFHRAGRWRTLLYRNAIGGNHATRPGLLRRNAMFRAFSRGPPLLAAAALIFAVLHLLPGNAAQVLLAILVTD